MAERVRALLGADMGIGVTGLAGPDGDGVHEVGTVFVSLATKDGTYVRELHVGDHRTRSYVRRVSGNYIFDMMRRYLQGLEVIKRKLELCRHPNGWRQCLSKSPAQLGFFDLPSGRQSPRIFYYAIFIRLKDDYLPLCARLPRIRSRADKTIVIVPEGEKIIDVGDVFKSYAGTAIVHGDDRFCIQRDSDLLCLLPDRSCSSRRRGS